MTEKSGDHHRRWYGNDEAQRILRGPFFAYNLTNGPLARLVDERFRKMGRFSQVYQRTYVVTGALNDESAKEIIEKLGLTISFEMLKVFSGQTLAECLEDVVKNEGLRIFGAGELRKDGNG